SRAGSRAWAGPPCGDPSSRTRIRRPCLCRWGTPVGFPIPLRFNAVGSHRFQHTPVGFPIPLRFTRLAYTVSNTPRWGFPCPSVSRGWLTPFPTHPGGVPHTPPFCAVVLHRDN